MDAIEQNGPQMDRLEKRKRGRPRKHVDLELVEKLAHIQCTQAEIASTLGVSVDTLWRNPKFAEVYKRGAEGGRKSLRRMQFESANKGNVAMLIWLGKQYLGQREQGREVNQPVAISELSAAQVRTMIEGYAGMVPDVREELESIDASYRVVASSSERAVLPAVLASR